MSDQLLEQLLDRIGDLLIEQREHRALTERVLAQVSQGGGSGLGPESHPAVQVIRGAIEMLSEGGRAVSKSELARRSGLHRTQFMRLIDPQKSTKPAVAEAWQEYESMLDAESRRRD